MLDPVLPDVLEPGLTLVFCGTAPSRRSAAEGAYYAHPGNAFWRTLFEAGLTPRRLRPHEYRMLLEFGIGLTDLAKHASGNDADLPADAFDTAALVRKVEATRPRILAFTSKRGARALLGRIPAYGVQPEAIGATTIYVLPSPSGQARRFFSIEPWRELAQISRQLTGPTYRCHPLPPKQIK
jgi:TDG/mug DNA glycosylase family protein